jgi:hypothetical protein
MADESTLMSLAPPSEQPTGGSMSPGPAMPTPGGGLVDRLGNAFAQAIGYATQNPQLQQQAIQRQDLAAKMEALAPVAQAHAAINERVAAGDLAGANQLYQKIAHLAPMYPEIGKTGDALAQQTFKQNFLAGNRQKALGQLDSLAQSEQDPVRQKLYRDAHQILGVSPLEESPSAAITAALQTSKMDLDIQKMNQEGYDFKVVNNRLVMTKKPGTEGPGAVTNVMDVPKEQTFDNLPTKIQEALPTLPGFRQSEYDRLRLSGAPEDKAAADDWINRGAVAAAVASQPSEARITAAAAGISPEALAKGLNPQEAARFRQQELAVDATKKAVELAQAKKLNLEMTPASMLPGMQHYEAYVTKDGKFNLVPATAMYGSEAISAVRGGQLQPLGKDQAQSMQMTQRLGPQFDRTEQLAGQLFAGVQPGANWGNAAKLKVTNAMGASAVRQRDALNVDIQAELARMATGSRVLATLINQYKDHVLLNDTDTYESGLAKIETMRGLQLNFRESLANMPLSPLDPYKSNVTLKSIQKGYRPVFDPQSGSVTGFMKANN